MQYLLYINLGYIYIILLFYIISIIIELLFQKKIAVRREPCIRSGLGVVAQRWNSLELRRVFILAVWYQMLNIIGDIGFLIVVEA